MGMRIFGSNSLSSYDFNSTPKPKLLKEDPNPKKFRIIKYKHIGKDLIVKIKYPDCNNYEGNKVLIFENLTIIELRKFKSIDPHFSKNKKFKSPFARFEPTKRGWESAESFLRIKNMKK